MKKFDYKKIADNHYQKIEVIENTLNLISASVKKANGIIESKTTPEIDLDCIIEKIIR